MRVSAFFIIFFFLFFFFLFFFNFCFVLSVMTTGFSKKKLAKAQEKKAKGGTISGLLSKKKTGDVSKKDSVTTILLLTRLLSALPLLLHHWR